jgi:hypothetical protein
MDYEKLERLARMMEPFEKTNKVIEAIPAAVRLADAAARINLPIANMNRIEELTAKVSSVSSSLNMRAVQSQDFPIFRQLSAVNQKAVAIASALSKSIQVSNLASNKFLDAFKASSLVVSKAVLEFTERSNELSEKINESFKLLPEAFLVLGDYGWYLNLDFELGLAIQLHQMLRDGKNEEVDDYLMQYFKSELKEITNELIIRHPTRKRIFEEIIFCVEHRKFFAAIPTVLSQVDGICSDMINMKFFAKDHRRGYKPKISVYISDQFPLVDNFFFAPIMTSPVIMLSENDARNHPFQINRHAVMHGMDVKYGTEVNFFKCFSLLKYLSDVLFELVEEMI